MSSTNALKRAAGLAGLAFVLSLSALAPGLAFAQGETQGPPPRRAAAAPRRGPALDSVRAESLRAHLSFLASDALEGRKTPSRGLDVAAEYIAAQFRRAGLDPLGDDGYFQTADWEVSGRADDYRLSFQSAGGGVSFGAQHSSLGLSAGGVALWAPEEGLALNKAGTVKIAYGDEAALAALTYEQGAGKVFVTEMPALLSQGRDRAFALLREQEAFLSRLRLLGAALVVSFDRTAERGRGAGAPRLADPEAPARPAPAGGLAAPLVVVHGEEAAKIYDSLPAGPTPATVTFRAPAVVRTPARVRNVAGVLRGSDPKLRDEYVIVSAHYDHIGVKANCRAGEDCVYNGANDDGSGAVGVIELADALARSKARPKRSVVFLTFFGEELGLMGSRYYARRPLVPLARTIAQINLEQIGRTDDSEGPQVGTAAVTGFDYSGVGAALALAGAGAGVRFYKHPKNSDAFFGRSDNQALADAGVPAHTLSVAFQFPDYHGLGDEWQKVDYDNMARVLRAVGLGVRRIADAPQAPRWNESNPKTAKYVEAWRKLHGQGEGN